MDIKQARKLQEESLERRWKIRERKGHDYATVDILSNFKRMSQVMDILSVDVTTPHGIALFYAMLKIDRFCNLVFRSDKTPMNESIEDTIDDLKNYIDLMEECMLENSRTN